MRQVRLVCGLVMFAYIFSHFSNHALGNISYDAMEAWLRYHYWWWRSPVGTTVLYSAAIVHLLLGLWALYQRRHFRFAAAEITQLVAGLSIPFLLTIHIVGVRLNGTLFDRDINYASAFYSYWVARPYMEWVQFTVLIVAWAHACIGLHFWLRLKPFYKRAGPFLLVGAALMPTLALLGLIQGARTTTQLASEPQWRAAHVAAAPPNQRAILDGIIFYFPVGYIGLISLVFVARGVRTLLERRRGMYTVSYPHRQARVPKGMSVLEASLRYRIPHASVCGGRARCSTCRVRVVSDISALPRPSGRETFVLTRVGVSADPSIRLACQLRPQSDVAIIPILQPNLGAGFVRARQRLHIGEERYVVSMFVDMRGSNQAIGSAATL